MEINHIYLIVNCLVAFLHEWQDLVGTIIGASVGGIIGYLAASKVANDRSKSEMEASAIEITAEQEQYYSLVDMYFKDKESVTELAQRLLRMPALLSPLYLSSRKTMNRLKNKDVRVVNHLCVLPVCITSG